MNPKQPKPTGESNENPGRKGLVSRVSDRLGKIAQADREYDKPVESEAQRQQVFETALARARGGNKVALQIIKAREQIPHQAGSKPTNGVDMSDPHTGEPLGRQWTAELAYAPKEEKKIPMTALTLSLGHLKADSPEWSGNALNIPVSTVKITCNQMLDNHDQPDGAPTTTVVINSMPSDPGDKDAWERPLGSGVKFTIDAVGRLESVSLTEDNGRNYAEYNPSTLQTSPEDFLNSVLASVEDTARAYRQIGSTE